ncbi:hypothetical protein BDP27DRAFT_1430792 [Rhodocollybia butyracea]|uniref:Uncharacterized protein n=1 Tax=Rhodocollybia butyracea TaxID=206335 RepID=A0A9P5PCT5_9AGAR|nr:hypothetical protein BDP27DRAFT_1430792 [Rhodocollybia butyracea]
MHIDDMASNTHSFQPQSSSHSVQMNSAPPSTSFHPFSSTAISPISPQQEFFSNGHQHNYLNQASTQKPPQTLLFAFSQQNELGIIMNQLKIQQEFLQNMYTAIGHEFSNIKSLINSPPKWNVPQHQQADFPKISYCTAVSYRAAKKSKSKISGFARLKDSKKPHPAFYLQEKDGTVISAETLEQIQGSIRSMCFDALRLGEAPRTFMQFGSVFLQQYEERICAQNPVLSYGESNWKATEVAKDIYSGWYDTYGPKDENKDLPISTTGLKREASKLISSDTKPKRAKTETASASVAVALAITSSNINVAATPLTVIDSFPAPLTEVVPFPVTTLNSTLSPISASSPALSPISVSTAASSPIPTPPPVLYPISMPSPAPSPTLTLSAAPCSISTPAPSLTPTSSTALSSVSTPAPSLTPMSSTAPSSVSTPAPSLTPTSSTTLSLNSTSIFPLPSTRLSNVALPPLPASSSMSSTAVPRITRSAFLANSASKMTVPAVYIPVAKATGGVLDDLFDLTPISRPLLLETASASTTAGLSFLDAIYVYLTGRPVGPTTTQPKPGSICKIKWCDANPAGTKTQFTRHWNDLGPAGRKAITLREAEMWMEIEQEIDADQVELLQEMEEDGYQFDDDDLDMGLVEHMDTLAIADAQSFGDM